MNRKIGPVASILTLLAITLYFLNNLASEHFKERREFAIEARNNLEEITQREPESLISPQEAGLKPENFERSDFFSNYYYKHDRYLVEETNGLSDIIQKLDLAPRVSQDWDDVWKLQYKSFEDARNLDESKASPDEKVKIGNNILFGASRIHLLIRPLLIEELKEAAKDQEQLALLLQHVCSWGAFMIFLLGTAVTLKYRNDPPAIGG
jgi:hypothetical protein